jgi:hypothetical protein
MLLLCVFAFRQIEHIGDPLVAALFECRPTHQYRHPSAILPRVLLLERRKVTAALVRLDPQIVAVAPVRRRQFRPGATLATGHARGRPTKSETYPETHSASRTFCKTLAPSPGSRSLYAGHALRSFSDLPEIVEFGLGAYPPNG